MGFACEVIADSVSRTGARLTTMTVTFPRIVLAEFNTHRAFSRNAASSRAIPVAKMIERVESDPFIPAEWLSNQKGMQGGEPIDPGNAPLATHVWTWGLHESVQAARHLAAMGVHKQYVNRLLEPWMWTTVIVSATEWTNFFDQRCSPLAQPEIRTMADMMRDALAGSTPRQAPYGTWHLPFCRKDDYVEAANLPDDPGGLGLWSPGYLHLIKLSVARCARVSYLNHDGVRSVADDHALYAKLRLADPPHLSPFEHVATPGNGSGNFSGWTQLRHLLPGITMSDAALLN